MNSNIKQYLTAYNLLSFFAWTVFFSSFIFDGFVLTLPGLTFLTIAQGLMILEIVHALVRWVKSPIMTTFAQVASRILVLVLLIIFYLSGELPEITRVGVIAIAIAWSITEMVRYSYYFMQLRGEVPHFLLTLRYSLFIILYPLGVTGEFLIFATPFAKDGFSFNPYAIFILAVTIVYIVFFPKLFGYMWKQRKLKL